MAKLFPALVLIAITAALSVPLTAEPAPEAQAIIEELYLKQAAQPIPVPEGWRPNKVLVMMLPMKPEAAEAYRSALQQAAGDTPLIIRSFKDGPITKEVLDGVDAVIGVCSEKLLKNAHEELRWVHSYTVGMDRCTGYTDLQLNNITFSNNQRLSAPSISEHTMAMLLALTRQLPHYVRSQSRSEWRPKPFTGAGFGELKGKTLLVVGLGGIGTEVARRAHGLGMRVLATRNSSREGPPFVEYVGLSDELHSLAAKSDIVVNSLPLTAATNGLFDEAFFRSIRPGSIFLSVGRGKSTDTQALIAALKSGQLYAAGLDVTDPEPLPDSSPLWTMENVIITPHVSAMGEATQSRTAVIAVENLRRFIAEEPLLNVVDLSRGY